MAEEQPMMLLTGASRGIGHATVKLFQEQGWGVLTVSHTPFSQRCAWAPAKETHIEADLSDLDSVDRLVAQAQARLPNGRLHALINSAAVSPKGAGGSRLGVMQTDAQLWWSVLNVNLVSTALLARKLQPNLASAGGSIVNVTSIAGSRVRPFAGVVYACSKAALTREMAKEFGHCGIRANAIAPGEIDTSILSPGTEEIVDRDIPLRRLGDAREVAEVIFFCARVKARTSTGRRSRSTADNMFESFRVI
jgi:NAD(P)-dependent dehydrogenase (short-subunit alcohol dehydrogenase family)